MEIALSGGEAGLLKLWLQAVNDFLAPTVAELQQQHPELATNESSGDLTANAKKFETAFAAVLPQYLVRYGFEEVRAFLEPDGGIPEWTRPLLPSGARPVVVDAFLAYIAKELMDLHKAQAPSVGSDDNVTSSEEGIFLLTVERMDFVIQSDEELSQLRDQIGFCFQADLGAHLHTPCNRAKQSYDEAALQRLEAACQTGTADEVQELLMGLGFQPFDTALVRGCTAASRALPTVPSRVAPPNFSTVKREAADGAEEEEEQFPSIDPRPTPLLVVSCHAGNIEVSRLLVTRYGADVMACTPDTEDEYRPLYAAVLTTPRAQVVELLLHHGAAAWVHVPVRSQGWLGWTVQRHSLLKLAIRNRAEEAVVRALLEHGAMSKLSTDKERVGVLESAAKAGRVDVMRMLLHDHQVPADIRPPELEEDEWSNGENRVYTPLMGAVANQQHAAAALLLEHQADPDQLFPSGTAVTQYDTPLRIAAQRGDARMVRLLRRFGAKWCRLNDCFVWGRDSSRGEAELQDAIVGFRTADKDRVEAVRALLECGATPSQHLSEMAAGDLPEERQHHDWKKIADDERHQIAALIVAAQSEASPAAKVQRVGNPTSAGAAP